VLGGGGRDLPGAGRGRGWDLPGAGGDAGAFPAKVCPCLHLICTLPLIRGNHGNCATAALPKAVGVRISNQILLFSVVQLVFSWCCGLVCVCLFILVIVRGSLELVWNFLVSMSALAKKRKKSLLVRAFSSRKKKRDPMPPSSSPVSSLNHHHQYHHYGTLPARLRSSSSSHRGCGALPALGWASSDWYGTIAGCPLPEIQESSADDLGSKPTWRIGSSSGHPSSRHSTVVSS
jgi:hypothetical protein